MSEKDKLRREEYRRKRKRWIIALTALLLLCAITTSFSFALYYQLNKTTYIPYTESGTADYRVQLLPNEFYEKETLSSGQSYVAALIDQITAELHYTMQMESYADFIYSYAIEAQLLVKTSSGEILYNPTEVIKQSASNRQTNSNSLSITEKIPIVYAHYNDWAKEFISTYQLPNATSTLCLRMNIHVLGTSDSFAQNTENSYTVALNIPLNTQTVRITSDTSVPTENGRVLAHTPTKNQALYQQISFGGAGLCMLLVIVLVLFIFLTRNTDINYTIKVRRLVNAYKSYIQEILNPFDTSHYQVLSVKTFNEMLDIRDTIQSPILMHENEDKTRTQFIIPTNNGILYCFEIKVDNYDELYGLVEQQNDLVEEQEMLPTVQDYTAQEPHTPIMEQAPLDTEITAEFADPADEQTAADGFVLGGPKLDYSFEAKLSLCDDEVRGYYREVCDFARSFGAKVTRSWPRERIYLGRNLFALMVFKGKKLAIALALDPATHNDPKYHAYDMSGSRKFQKTPLLIRITSPRKVKYVTELLTELFTAAGLKDKKLSLPATEALAKTKTELLEMGLIRIEGASNTQ